MRRNFVVFLWSGCLLKWVPSMLGLVTDKLSKCAIFLKENNGSNKSSIVQIFFLVCFQARVSSMWARCIENTHFTCRQEQAACLIRSEFRIFIPMPSFYLTQTAATMYWGRFRLFNCDKYQLRFPRVLGLMFISHVQNWKLQNMTLRNS